MFVEAVVSALAMINSAVKSGFMLFACSLAAFEGTQRWWGTIKDDIKHPLAQGAGQECVYPRTAA